MLRIGHWQLESKTGDFDANLAKVVSGLARADKDRVEVVSFPECFLTGYPDKEEPARKSAFAVDSPQMMTLLDKTGKFEATYIVGFNELRGKDLYNTAVVVQKGHILGTYSKCKPFTYCSSTAIILPFTLSGSSAHAHANGNTAPKRRQLRPIQ